MYSVPEKIILRSYFLRCHVLEFEAPAVEYENIASVTAIGGNLARSRPLFIWQPDTDGLTTANNMSIIDPDMSHLLLLGKFEYGGGPIFKVVLEC